MKHNRFKWLFVTIAAAALTTFSCSKSENLSPEPEPQPTPETSVDICITGDFNDFGTKAEIENIFRMTWSATDTATVRDTVYVYGQNNSAITFLGKLAAYPVEGTGNRVADLKGTIIAPGNDTKLTLVYSPVLTEAPEVSGDAISIDLKNQSGRADSVVFVAYTAVDYKESETAAYRTSFNFATSVLRVNVSDLTANTALTQAKLGEIETACKLTFKSDTNPTVTGETTDTITRTLSGCSANAKGCAAFYVAVPIISANTYRTLTVTQQGGKEYDAIGFATGAKGAGKMMNSISPMVTTGQHGILNGQEYVLIRAKYDGTHNSYLKWATQNLAVTASGKAKWNGTDYVIGDYFQWAASYDGYGLDGTTGKEKIPANLVIYDSFTNTCAGGASNAFTFKSGKTFAVASAPYYDGTSSYTKYNTIDTKTTLDLTDDVASIVLGGTWRMPTEGSNGQFTAMRAATYWAWDTTDKGYYIFNPGVGTSGAAGGSGNIAETDDKTKALLFFPVAGWGTAEILSDAASTGYYLSSTRYSAVLAYYLYFNSTSVSIYKTSRYNGFSVRPVSD